MVSICGKNRKCIISRFGDGQLPAPANLSVMLASGQCCAGSPGLSGPRPAHQEPKQRVKLCETQRDPCCAFPPHSGAGTPGIRGRTRATSEMMIRLRDQDVVEVEMEPRTRLARATPRVAARAEIVVSGCRSGHFGPDPIASCRSSLVLSFAYGLGPGKGGCTWCCPAIGAHVSKSPARNAQPPPGSHRPWRTSRFR